MNESNSVVCVVDDDASTRERKEDIPLLATYFIEVLVKELGCPKPGLTQTGIEMLLAYHWLGSRIVVPLCPAAAVLNHLTPSSRGSTPRARRTESRKVARSRTHTICRILCLTN